MLALVVASSWFFLQADCVTDREASTDPAMSIVILTAQGDSVIQQHDRAIPISTKKEERSDSRETPSHSLKHASILLHRAANVIEKDDALAVQLIRQVIAILKHQVIPSLLDHHSSLVPIHSLSEVAERRMGHEEPISASGQSLLGEESSILFNRGKAQF